MKKSFCELCINDLLIYWSIFQSISLSFSFSIHLFLWTISLCCSYKHAWMCYCFFIISFFDLNGNIASIFFFKLMTNSNASCIWKSKSYKENKKKTKKNMFKNNFFNSFKASFPCLIGCCTLFVHRVAVACHIWQPSTQGDTQP